MIHDNINSYEYLVREHQGLVYHIVNRFQVSSFDRDDLIQAGMMGLLSAIKKFDVLKGGAFSTYAIPYIIGSVKKEYQRQNSLIDSDYYLRLIKNVHKEDLGLSYQELAVKYKTTVENIIIALNFSPKITYLNDEELDLIAEPKNRVLDLGTLDSDELIIYQMRVMENRSQKEIAKTLGVNQSTISRKIKNITQKVLLKV